MKGPGCKGRNRKVGQVDDCGLRRHDPRWHINNMLKGGPLTLDDIEKTLGTCLGSPLKRSVVVDILHEMTRGGLLETVSRDIGRRRMKKTIIVFQIPDTSEMP